MKVEMADDIRDQAIAAGYASVEDYLAELVRRDAERIAIQQGLDDVRAGRVETFEDFDRRIRKEFGFAPRP